MKTSQPIKKTKNGSKYHDPLNSYYDIEVEDYEEFTHKAGFFSGCALAVFVAAALISSIWYVFEMIF